MFIIEHPDLLNSLEEYQIVAQEEPQKLLTTLENQAKVWLETAKEWVKNTPSIVLETIETQRKEHTDFHKKFVNQKEALKSSYLQWNPEIEKEWETMESQMATLGESFQVAKSFYNAKVLVHDDLTKKWVPASYPGFSKVEIKMFNEAGARN